ncbi:MAG TPA: hypothetical protein HA286_01480 [Candidatus Poseidoniaceae archaeon]|nr:hypothetical protein [Candidatus Poseidoniaceae archaeon]
MYQCTACGLLSVRDDSCPACGGASFIDLEAEDATSLEGFGEVPGLDEAASALHEIAPPPEEEAVEEEPEGDLPFGFGGQARTHAPSLPFGFGASSQGLSAFTGGSEAASGSKAPSEGDPVQDPKTPAPSTGDEHEDEASGHEEPLDNATQSVDAPFSLPPVPEVVPTASVDPLDHNSAPEHGFDVPDLWSGAAVDVREAYGLAEPMETPPATSSMAAINEINWPPWAVVTPEPALLSGLLREPTVEAFRALAEEQWSLANERIELLLATGIDGSSLRTAAGIACMEQSDKTAEGLQHLKQAAKISGGDLPTLHNLAVAMAMDARFDAVDRLLASVSNLPDEGGFVSRMREARKLMETTSV